MKTQNLSLFVLKEKKTKFMETAKTIGIQRFLPKTEQKRNARSRVYKSIIELIENTGFERFKLLK